MTTKAARDFTPTDIGKTVSYILYGNIIAGEVTMVVHRDKYTRLGIRGARFQWARPETRVTIIDRKETPNV